jgi:hypothetical protein
MAGHRTLAMCGFAKARREPEEDAKRLPIANFLRWLRGYRASDNLAYRLRGPAPFSIANF